MENRGKKREIFKTNIMIEKKIFLGFRKQKKWGKKTQFFFLFLKKQKKENKAMKRKQK